MVIYPIQILLRYYKIFFLIPRTALQNLYKNLSLAEVKEYNFLGNIIDNKGRFKRSAQELSPRTALQNS
jgi:hypothetical protein